MIQKIFIALFASVAIFSATAAEHPSLLMTPGGVSSMRADIGKNGLFDSSIADLRRDADAALASPMVVPVPKDGGGGVTHETHKGNYYKMFNCGVMYQITGQKRYADYVAKMLGEYAKLYPTLDYHPITMSHVRGRLFWQTLNDHVWLIHTSVAYDCIYDYLTAEQRESFESKIFRPMVKFITEGNDANRKVFNMMHNHGTWASAAVGMISYVMGDKESVRKALYGSDMTGKNGGFLMQLHRLFSPDGYFTEGPYYQRYSIWPFVIFAQAINNNDPDLKIFDYRDGIIKKAVNTLAQETSDGALFMLNDAMPKGYDTQELIYAIDILYNADPSQKQLLDIVSRYQKRVLPTDAGYIVARDIASGQSQPFVLRSLLLRDGMDGNKGGVAILRGQRSDENSTLILKATSHGLSHGHYDKLMMALYDNGSPVVMDYGAARFHNIEVKHNGNYTPLNKAFAMSTIAHNTLAVDGQSHYGGDYDTSMKHNPDIYIYDVANPELQVVSAVERGNAYKGVEMQRTLLYMADVAPNSVVLDIFSARSDEPHTYDLPLYFNGQMISVNAPYTKSMDALKPFGPANGYQYLWHEAQGQAATPLNCFTWLIGNRFYSLSTLSNQNTSFHFVRTGANDQNYFLRSEQGYVLRQSEAKNHTFVSILEPHGDYNTAYETISGARSAVSEIRLVVDNHLYTVVEFTIGGRKSLFAMANRAGEGESHKVSVDGRKLSWRGKYMFEKR